jgi:hypothetical protein
MSAGTTEEAAKAYFMGQTFTMDDEVTKKKVVNVQMVRSCSKCGGIFVPEYGEHSRCQACLSSDVAAGEQATGVEEQTTENRMVSIKEGLERKSKKGNLSNKEATLLRRLTESLAQRGR